MVGSNGCLDLVVCYLSANDAADRRASVSALSAHLRPPTSVLSAVFGDFNFVEHREDRVSKASGSFPDHSNSSETKHFRDCVLNKYSLAEWWQPERACDMALARSRLDRCYSNMSLSEQQDRSISCVALAWARVLSTHRPLHFSRRTKAKSSRSPVKMAHINHPNFVQSVTETFETHLFHHGRPTDPLIRLRILKDSIKIACQDLAREAKILQASTVEEQLSASLGALRAWQSGASVALADHLARYSKLHEFFLGSPLSLNAGRLASLQSHIVELCHQQVQARLTTLKRNRHCMEDVTYSTQKKNILMQMKRLLLGSSSSTIGGIWDDVSQSVITDEDGIARELTGFWQTVFEQKNIDTQLLNQWLS